jgi:capsular exopolysaccharide synthesis family protein
MFDRFSSDRDASQIIQALRRRWPIILVLAVIAAAVAYELAKHQPKKYTATAALLFQNSPFDQIFFGVSLSGQTDPTTQAGTNLSLVELPSVAEAVAATLHVPRGDVSSAITFGTPASSNVVSVVATTTSPALSARLANTYVAEYITIRQRSDQAQLTQAENLVNTQIKATPTAQQNTSAFASLRSRSDELKLLASLQTGDAQAVQTATPPSSASSPKPLPDAVLGLLLGLLVGAGLAVVLERRDRRIKTAEEAKELYGLPVIGEIPRAKVAAPGGFGTAGEQEAFHMLRAQLRYFNVDRQVKRVLITSAESGEGKSFVALNLARAAVRTDGKRALLIEADLRRPSLGRVLGLTGMAGLAELLSQSHDLTLGLRELVVPLEAMDDASSRTPRCDLLLAGAAPPNPVELLESKGMAELLRFAGTVYDVVIIDTTPIGIISDAISLVHQVDGVVLITRPGFSGRDHARRLMTQLRELNAHILGLVINGSQGAPDYYEYRDAGQELPVGSRSARQSRIAERERRSRSASKR